MVGPWPLAPHHDHLQYIHHHIHLMQRGQNRGVTQALISNLLIRMAQHLYLTYLSEWRVLTSDLVVTNPTVTSEWPPVPD